MVVDFYKIGPDGSFDVYIFLLFQNLGDLVDFVAQEWLRCGFGYARTPAPSLPTLRNQGTTAIVISIVHDLVGGCASLAASRIKLFSTSCALEPGGPPLSLLAQRK